MLNVGYHQFEVKPPTINQLISCIYSIYIFINPPFIELACLSLSYIFFVVHPSLRAKNLRKDWPSSEWSLAKTSSNPL